jgi:FkbM family methyltransferase
MGRERINKLSEFLYNRFRPPKTVSDFIDIIQRQSIDVDWGVEAGAHQGTDSIEFLSDKSIRKLFLFEPNSDCLEVCRKNLKPFPRESYELFPMGLSAKRSIGVFYLPTIDMGGMKRHLAGSSSLYSSWAKSDGSTFQAELIPLDECFYNEGKAFF